MREVPGHSKKRHISCLLASITYQSHSHGVIVLGGISQWRSNKMIKSFHAVLAPWRLTAPSSRRLFSRPDEIREPWQASEKSDTINPTRLPQVAALCLAFPCRHQAVTAVSRAVWVAALMGVGADLVYKEPGSGSSNPGQAGSAGEGLFRRTWFRNRAGSIPVGWVNTPRPLFSLSHFQFAVDQCCISDLQVPACWSSLRLCHTGVRVEEAPRGPVPPPHGTIIRVCPLHRQLVQGQTPVSPRHTSSDLTSSCAATRVVPKHQTYRQPGCDLWHRQPHIRLFMRPVRRRLAGNHFNLSHLPQNLEPRSRSPQLCVWAASL